MRLAWAMTFNRAQGQTVGVRLGVYLPTPVFSHGQLYSAFGRAKTAKNVRAVVDDDPVAGGQGLQALAHRVLTAGPAGADTGNLAVTALAHQAGPPFHGALVQHQHDLGHRPEGLKRIQGVGDQGNSQDRSKDLVDAAHTAAPAGGHHHHPSPGAGRLVRMRIGGGGHGQLSQPWAGRR